MGEEHIVMAEDLNEAMKSAGINSEAERDEFIALITANKQVQQVKIPQEIETKKILVKDRLNGMARRRVWPNRTYGLQKSCCRQG